MPEAPCDGGTRPLELGTESIPKVYRGIVRSPAASPNTRKTNARTNGGRPAESLPEQGSLLNPTPSIWRSGIWKTIPR